MTKTQELSKILVNSALEQVAKDAGMTVSQILALMLTDTSVAQRVAQYIKVGVEVAKSEELYNTLKAA